MKDMFDIFREIKQLSKRGKIFLPEDFDPLTKDPDELYDIQGGKCCICKKKIKLTKKVSAVVVFDPEKDHPYGLACLKCGNVLKKKNIVHNIDFEGEQKLLTILGTKETQLIGIAARLSKIPKSQYTRKVVK